jgi:hypothetical protein
VDADNSLDDQYLEGQDIARILQALDYFINRPEGQWQGIDPNEAQRWTPYRRLRGRLQDQLGIRMWDDAAQWIEHALREERRATIAHIRVRLEALLREQKMTRAMLRNHLSELASEAHDKQFTNPLAPRPTIMPETARQDRLRQVFDASNWRRTQADYSPSSREKKPD